MASKMDGFKKVLLKRISYDYYTKCWNWTGDHNERGYGRYNNAKVHRLSYALFIGEIPKGAHICHICDNPKCFNPKHLFLGTHADNMRDKVKKGRDAKSIAGINRTKIECVQGHPFSGDNLIVKKSGERRCRKCHNQQLRKLYWDRKQVHNAVS